MGRIRFLLSARPSLHATLRSRAVPFASMFAFYCEICIQTLTSCLANTRPANIYALNEWTTDAYSI